jgi:hypothetical protein
MDKSYVWDYHKIKNYTNTISINEDWWNFDPPTRITFDLPCRHVREIYEIVKLTFWTYAPSFNPHMFEI